MQQSLGKRWGRGQKVVAYSDAISTMLNLLSSFTDDKMIPKPITVHNNFIIILSQYIIFSQNVCYTLYITHISRQECLGVLELECTINIKAISVLFCKMTTPFICLLYTSFFRPFSVFSEKGFFVFLVIQRIISKAVRNIRR